MIATAKSNRQHSARAWHQKFLAMLPTISTYAQISFSSLTPEAKEELVQEVICNCLVAFVRLIQLGKGDLAYAGVLARYAVAQVKQGRQVGSRFTISDVMSRFCQHRKGFSLERLDTFCLEAEEWIEVIVVDRQTSVPDQVAFRIDVPQWLATLTQRARTIATDLATGWTTSEVARKYHLSDGRVSQIRRELFESWQKFHGDADGAAAV